jgi:hypothetical protein
LSKGGADDFRSWVSTNASPPPCCHCQSKSSIPHFSLTVPMFLPSPALQSFFLLYRCLLSRDARLKKKIFFN